jgi:hypothetical protein
MSGHPLFWLLFVTLIAFGGFGAWSYMSAHRNQKTGGNTSGVGGPNDPLA